MIWDINQYQPWIMQGTNTKNISQESIFLSDLQRKQRCPKAQGQLWKRWQASTLRWKQILENVDFLARSLIQVLPQLKCLRLLIVLNKRSLGIYFLFWLTKELFAELDKEEDGVVYTKNLIVQLRALNVDMDKNLKVDEKFDESISFKHLFMKLQRKTILDNSNY